MLPEFIALKHNCSVKLFSSLDLQVIFNSFNILGILNRSFTFLSFLKIHKMRWDSKKFPFTVFGIFGEGLKLSFKSLLNILDLVVHSLCHLFRWSINYDFSVAFCLLVLVPHSSVFWIQTNMNPERLKTLLDLSIHLISKVSFMIILLCKDQKLSNKVITNANFKIV